MDSGEIAELLQILIRNACVNDGTVASGFEHRSVATLRDYLGEPGVEFEPHPGRTSVLYDLPASDPAAPKLLLMGHLDVVPADGAGWQHDPFGGDIVDGFVWGRGAVDMLNQTAAMAAVFKGYLRGVGKPPAGGLAFLGVADEEAGGRWGAHYLTENHWDQVRCDYLLTEIAYPPIRTGSGPAYPVSVGEKGPFWRRFRSAGTPGHASQPYGTDNALGAAGPGSRQSGSSSVTGFHQRRMAHLCGRSRPACRRGRRPRRPRPGRCGRCCAFS